MSNEIANDVSERKYLSDIIGLDYLSWQSQDIILLNCGTGTGKSTFCINVLGAHCLSTDQKVLYVCNRTALKDDITTRLEILAESTPQIKEVVSIMTYQYIEARFKNNAEATETELASYKYVFLDEVHYFTNDSAMNMYTEVTYTYFLTKCRKSILIYSSATAPELFNFLQKQYSIPLSHIYTIEQDYSFVNDVILYNKGQLIQLLENILDQDNKSKAIVFCKDGNRIIELYNKFGPKISTVYCSSSYKDKRVRGIANRKAIHNNTFEQRILITTSVIDNGVDLKDKQIKHVFTEMPQLDTIIQTLGRKRPIDNEDTCSYYIRNYTNEELDSFNRNNILQIDDAKLLTEDSDAFGEKYKNDRLKIKTNKIIYYDIDEQKLKVNSIALARFTIIKNEYMKAIKRGFYDYLKERLPESLTEILTISDAPDYQDEFMEWLKSIEGKIIYRDDFVKCKGFVSAQMKQCGYYSQRTGINDINSFIVTRYGGKYKYQFVSKRDYRRTIDNKPNIGYKKTYYILE